MKYRFEIDWDYSHLLIRCHFCPGPKALNFADYQMVVWTQAPILRAQAFSFNDWHPGQYVPRVRHGAPFAGQTMRLGIPPNMNSTSHAELSHNAQNLFTELIRLILCHIKKNANAKYQQFISNRASASHSVETTVTVIESV